MPHTWGPKAVRQQQTNSPATRRDLSRPLPEQPVKARVLFVCIGNSCRSQMAEGFARHYGQDVMEVSSAGLAPAQLVAPLTRQAMLAAKGIDLSGHWPKSIFEVPGPFDLIVNISGHPLPSGVSSAEVRNWAVHDPVSDDEPVHRQVADQIESLVQLLILEFRHRKI